MAECLGLYIENNLIKYAKISKERDNIKVEAFGVKTFDKLDEVLKQIIQETYSFKTQISVNLSGEMYNYFDVFAMLNKKDSERAIKTEFEFYCEEREFNKNILESRYFTVNNIDAGDKLRTIHVSVNKTELAKRSQQLEGYKLRNISPLPVSVSNLVDVEFGENIAIVNIEENTSITLIINGQVYRIDVLEHGMKEIFDKINIRENSYAKAYEICKNTTIYTAEGRNLQDEESDYLDEIMPTLYNIVQKIRDIVSNAQFNISKLYITGTGALINNIDLYFQEGLQQLKCEILKPYFVQTENVRLNIKDYIEVNSAIALALNGLGEGIKSVNFKNVSLLEKIELPSIIPSKKEEKDGKKKIDLFSKVSGLSFDLGGELDKIEKMLLRFAGTILVLIILYSIFSNIVGQQIISKTEEVEGTINSINTQIAAVDSDINKIRTRKSEYTNYINNLRALNDKTTEKYKARNAIPNLLNRIMSCIPKNVQLTSIENSAGTHVVIKAQSETYEPLGIFKAELALEGVLTEVKSDSSTKDGNVVKVTIEGELP